MRNIAKAIWGVSMAALAAGCGGGSQADNESAAAANMQAPANGAAEAMPSGPFAQIEMQMNERMMAATGANAAETWARKMIEHHRGAVQMAQLLIDRGGDPQMVEMAQAAVEKQQRAIAELERLLAAGISGGAGEADPFGPVEQRMHQAMMAATGADLSQTWARKMIAHHQGAVDMSELLVRQGADPQILALARRTAEEQRREIAHLEAMLRGEGMPADGAPAAPAAPARERPRGTPAPARQPAPAPKAAPAPRDRPAPRPAPEPEPPAPPKTPCLPEHRAAGHC